MFKGTCQDDCYLQAHLSDITQIKSMGTFSPKYFFHRNHSLSKGCRLKQFDEKS